MWFHSGSLLDISLLELSVKPLCLVLSAGSSHTLSSYESLASLVKSTCFSKSDFSCVFIQDQDINNFEIQTVEISGNETE